MNEITTVYEDEATGDQFVVYGTAGGVQVEVRCEGDSLWLTQSQIAEVFGRDQSVISRHISNIFAEEELPEEGNMQKMHIAGSAKPVATYSLDAVISVGYRVSSKQATMFRKWATERLVSFATKGFVVDKAKLKGPDYSDRIKELRELVREIRADEANVYRELRTICSMCRDYDGGGEEWKRFYTHMQAKLVWAVTSHTPAELVAGRADATLPNMGLETWPNENIRKSDVSVSKNYLAEPEARELNRLTTILLDIFEDQLEFGKLIMMKDAEQLLVDQLKGLNRPILQDGGSMRTGRAKALAEAEYAKFSEQRRGLRHAEADRAIATLKKAAAELPKGKGRKVN